MDHNLGDPWDHRPDNIAQGLVRTNLKTISYPLANQKRQKNRRLRFAISRLILLVQFLLDVFRQIL